MIFLTLFIKRRNDLPAREIFISGAVQRVIFGVVRKIHPTFYFF